MSVIRPSASPPLVVLCSSAMTAAGTASATTTASVLINRIVLSSGANSVPVPWGDSGVRGKGYAAVGLAFAPQEADHESTGALSPRDDMAKQTTETARAKGRDGPARLGRGLRRWGRLLGGPSLHR